VDGDRRPRRWLAVKDPCVLLVHDRVVIHADEEDVGFTTSVKWASCDSTTCCSAVSACAVCARTPSARTPSFNPSWPETASQPPAATPGRKGRAALMLAPSAVAVWPLCQHRSAGCTWPGRLRRSCSAWRQWPSSRSGACGEEFRDRGTAAQHLLHVVQHVPGLPSPVPGVPDEGSWSAFARSGEHLEQPVAGCGRQRPGRERP
jgi:hypothetical protein